MNISKIVLRTGVVLVLLLGAPVVHAQLVLTLLFSSNAAGISLGGTGTPAAAIVLGSVQAFGGTIPGGVTRTVGASSWTLSTPFNVEVLAAGIITVPSFTLTAKLLTADAVNTWKIGSLTLNSVTATTLTTTGPYDVNVPYTFNLTIPFSEAAGLIINTMNFTATSN